MSRYKVTFPFSKKVWPLCWHLESWMGWWQNSEPFILKPTDSLSSKWMYIDAKEHKGFLKRQERQEQQPSRRLVPLGISPPWASLEGLEKLCWSSENISFSRHCREKSRWDSSPWDSSSNSGMSQSRKTSSATSTDIREAPATELLSFVGFLFTLVYLWRNSISR